MVTTDAAVIKDGGGSVGHWCPHAVWGGRLRRVETLGGSQNFTVYVGTMTFIQLMMMEKEKLYPSKHYLKHFTLLNT